MRPLLYLARALRRDNRGAWGTASVLKAPRDGERAACLGGRPPARRGTANLLTLIARPPGEHERGFFGLSDKALVAIFEFQRTSYGEDGKPIRFALTVYPADRNQFEMEAGRVPAPAG